MADAGLDSLLARAAAGIPVPDVDRFAAAVGSRLRTEEAPRRGNEAPWRRPLWVAVAIVVVVALVIAALPVTRSAVAHRLSIGCVRVQPVPGSSATTASAATRPGSDPLAVLDLGTRVSLSEAAGQIDFAVAVPAAPGYEHPDAVYVRTPPPGGMVSLVYGPTAQRPASPAAPVGVLLSEFRGAVDPVIFKKLVGTGTTLAFVIVGGQPGYWISGALHEIVFTDEKGNERSDTMRLAANTLLWSRAGVTYRLESSLSVEEAVALAASVR